MHFLIPYQRLSQLMDAGHTSLNARQKAAKPKLDIFLTKEMHTQLAICTSMCICVGALMCCTKDANKVRSKIIGSILRDGTITASFARKGKGKVTYSHCQHMRAETRYEVVELL